MKIKSALIFMILFIFLLTACTAANETKKNASEQSSPAVNLTDTSVEDEKTESVEPNAFPTAPIPVFDTQSDLVRVDEQGAVTFEITPSDLNSSNDALIFEVSMNTHSVSLDMDLAQLSELSTDTGKSVKGMQWDGPKGGHHVSGQLVFQTIVDGENILTDAKSVTLTIRDVDAPSRIFSWQINK